MTEHRWNRIKHSGPESLFKNLVVVKDNVLDLLARVRKLDEHVLCAPTKLVRVRNVDRDGVVPEVNVVSKRPERRRNEKERK